MSLFYLIGLFDKIWTIGIVYLEDRHDLFYQTCLVFLLIIKIIIISGTAMAWSSSLGILMKIFPNKVARVMSWTQTCFGLGYMLGPGVGAALYEAGGFMLPFLIIGSLSTLFSIALAFTIPDVSEVQEEQQGPPQQQLK